MALARTTADQDPPFGPAVVKRGLAIQYVVEQRDPLTQAWSTKDISGSQWTYRVRTWASDDDDDPIIDAELTKGAESASGELDHYQACGATVRDTLTWELVEVDNDNADAATRTGKRERVIVRWKQPIIDAP